MNKIRTMVVDDEPMARERLVGLLGQEKDIELIGECADGSQAITAIPQIDPVAPAFDAALNASDDAENTPVPSRFLNRFAHASRPAGEGSAKNAPRSAECFASVAITASEMVCSEPTVGLMPGPMNKSARSVWPTQ